MQLTKLDVATHQLQVAILLFLSGDLICSLTLAGAAEEILGKLSERAGMPVAVDEITRHHADDIDDVLPEAERRRVLLKILNTGRNQVKHANDPNETHFFNETIWPLQMIMRALPMALNLGAPMSDAKVKMDAWISANPDVFE
jgi:hypothetical protein